MFKQFNYFLFSSNQFDNLVRFLVCATGCDHFEMGKKITR